MTKGALAAFLAQEIAAHGPMPVERYMTHCLMHPTLGYYRGAEAVGARGDFITAPEISQIFGELIGIWTAAAWTQLDAPNRWRLVELGPGRGTLMSDLLRALRLLPAALGGLEIVLVEANKLLRQRQQEALADVTVPVHWLEETGELAGLPPLPGVLVANEFLDALPIRQVVRQSGHWHERCVRLKQAGAGLEFCAAPHPNPLPPEDGGEGIAAAAPEGAIREVLSGAAALIADLARPSPGYLLFVDYGHVGPVFGDTLQAVAGHRHVGPLEAPGDHDLSAQVDFAQVRDAGLDAGLQALGPMTQAEFLGRLGAAERLERLTRGKDAGTVQALQLGLARLMQPDGMGGRFKAFALASKGLAKPPIF